MIFVLFVVYRNANKTTMTTKEIQNTGLELIKSERNNRKFIDGEKVTIWMVKSKNNHVGTYSTKSKALDVIGQHWMQLDGVKEGDKIIIKGESEKVNLNWWACGEMNITFSDGESLTDSTRYYRGK